MYGARRLGQLPNYVFNELEWKASALRQNGVDVIPLGFGDPDRPTHATIIETAQRALADDTTHSYSTNRGRPEFRAAVAHYYRRRFGVELDAETMVIPALGAKECIFNINLAFLDPGDIALVPDPGYQIYTAGPLLVGAEPLLMPLRESNYFTPDLGAIPRLALRRARLMYLNYPNTPTGAVARTGFFEEVVEFASTHELLVVHDNVYSEITFDDYTAPSFLATPGAADVGVEVISLSKTYNMAGWRCAALVGNPQALEAYRRLKTFVDSGMFDAVQLAGATALDPALDSHVSESVLAYSRRRDMVCKKLSDAGFSVVIPKGGVYVWARVPQSFESSAAFCEHVLNEAKVALSPGASYGPNGEGHFRLSLTQDDDRLLAAVDQIIWCSNSRQR